jgi:hypothetical protein
MVVQQKTGTERHIGHDIVDDTQCAVHCKFRRRQACGKTMKTAGSSASGLNGSMGRRGNPYDNA